MAEREKVVAVIAAAGLGQRMGGIDKLFALLGGKPVLARVIDTFQKCQAIDQIVIVLSQENMRQGEQLAAEQKWSKVTDICRGGERRQAHRGANRRPGGVERPDEGNEAGRRRAEKDQ